MIRKQRDTQRQRLLKKEYENGKTFLSCALCGKSFKLELWNGRFQCLVTVDHIVNVSVAPALGNNDKNTQWLCWECNMLKKRHGGV